MFNKHEKGNKGIWTDKDAPESLLPGLVYTEAEMDSSWE